MKYRHFGQCPFCNIMEGPYDSATEVKDVMKSLHRLCGPHQTVEIGGTTITTPVKTARVYTRGDVSRPFGSGFNGTCYECGFGYNEGEFICMVTYQDGEKGKAVHEGCVPRAKAAMEAQDLAGQSDEPPF